MEPKNASSRPSLVADSEVDRSFEVMAIDPGSEEPLRTRAAVAALSMALSGMAGDPNRQVKDGNKGAHPLLMAVLGALYEDRVRFFNDDPRPARSHNRKRNMPAKVDLSLDPLVPLPEAARGLPVRERLALVLIRQGADPWTKDSEGLDALDWAVRAQARSLFQALLAHPKCPPLSELKKRTSTHPGRELPWLHALAYSNGIEMIEDLVGNGWDLRQKDKNGWPVAAWANARFTLEALLEPLPAPERNEQRPILEKAWARRQSLRLIGPSFRLEDMTQALEILAALSPRAKKEIEIFQVVEGWLAANPAHNSYTYKGARWKKGSPSSQAPPSVQEFVDFFDKRFSKRAGAAKGTWSMLSAAAWSVVRAERHYLADREFLKTMEQVLHAVPTKEREEWMEEEIRPGMTNRGLLYWGFSAMLTSSQKELLAGSGSDSQRKQCLVESACQAALTMARGARSESASKLVNEKIREVWGEEKMSLEKSSWAWPLLSTLTKKGLFKPALPLQPYVQQCKTLVGALGREKGEDLQAAFDACMGLLSLGPPVALSPNVSDRQRIIDHFNAQTIRLWEAMRQALGQTPSLAKDLDAASPIFKNSPVGLEEMGFPSIEEWEALVTEAKMKCTLGPAAPSTKFQGSRL